MTDDDLRQHSLPLEDVQRLHLGLEHHDAMDFSAETIARMLQAIADEVSVVKAIKIHAIVRALRGEDQHHKLELRQVRRGRHKLAHDRAADREQDQQWLESLASYEREGMKTEAAVAAIAEEWNVSRASVFAGIKAAELMLELGRSVNLSLGTDPGEYANPRPSKMQNG